MGLTLNKTVKSFKDFTMTTEFSVNNGELLTLLGPSGCGKTTTLQLIAGILKPDSGNIILNGKDITFLEPWKRDIGIVFQDYALFPHMNVAQNISYGLKRKKHDRTSIKKTVRDFLDLVRLAGYENRSIDSLSGGEKQRVALARALAPNPGLLLLDEPLSALDASMRKDLRREIRRIQKKLNITTVYVTHDQEEALTISDRILIMSNGRIEQEGTPCEIFNKPETEFSARFLGHSNLIKGEVVNILENAGTDVLIRHGGIFKTPFKAGLKKGDPVWLFFRSTNTLITSENTFDSNILEGRITCREYYGTHILYEIENSGRIIKAEYKENPGKEHKELEEGKSVSVYVPPEHCYLIERFSKS